jgi:hypothetical protein
MAQRWIEAILASRKEDGWIGPVQAPDRRPYDIWPVTIVLKVLTQYAEATGDSRAVDAVSGFCRWLHANLDAHPLFDWGAYRWADLVLSVFWLYRRTREDWLLDLADNIQRQGYDWADHFTNFRFPNKIPHDECILKTHVVNNAMAIKTPGIWFQRSKRDEDRRAVLDAMANLDRYHGQATGVFTGDEHYAGKEPTQGTELCAVVEYMFSLETLLAALGDPAFGDRLERIAFNALPGANTEDMKAHQYDQQANQALCTDAPRDWTNNTDTSNLFGLEPHFGCCAANLHQGWPKLASHLWMATPDGGLAAVAYAPCEVSALAGDGASVRWTVETEYPFRETVRLSFDADHSVHFPLSLRIPEWAEGASMKVAGGDAVTAQPGTFHRIERTWTPGDAVELRFPMAIRAEKREHGAVALHRGPLVFALKIGEDRRRIDDRPGFGDWEVLPTTPWNYGLALDPDRPEESLAVEEAPISAMPFDAAHPPVTLKAKGRRIPEWGMVRNSAGPAPQSPAQSGEPLEDVELIPYGNGQLRMTELPHLADR